VNNGDVSNDGGSRPIINERMLMVILIVSVLVFMLAAFGCYRYRRNGELKQKEALEIGSIDFN
jgi:hypothetical protein